MDFALQEVAKEVNLIAETLNFIQGVAVVIRESLNQRPCLNRFLAQMRLLKTCLSLCPTRWCILALAIFRVYVTYPIGLLLESQLENDESMRGETRARISGLDKVNSCDFMSVCCTVKLFLHLVKL